MQLAWRVSFTRLVLQKCASQPSFPVSGGARRQFLHDSRGQRHSHSGRGGGLSGGGMSGTSGQWLASSVSYQSQGELQQPSKITILEPNFKK